MVMGRKQKSIICDNCGIEYLKNLSEIKRNKKLGRKNYCSRSCSGKANSKHLLKYTEINKKYLVGGSEPDEFTGLREHLRRVKRRFHDYDITLEDLLEQWEKQDGICIYSGVKLNHPKDGGTNLTKASLDRIDSSKGYIKGNIQFISITCNHAKSDMSHEQMLNFCEMISKNYKQMIV